MPGLPDDEKQDHLHTEDDYGLSNGWIPHSVKRRYTMITPPMGANSASSHSNQFAMAEQDDTVLSGDGVELVQPRGRGAEQRIAFLDYIRPTIRALMLFGFYSKSNPLYQRRGLCAAKSYMSLLFSVLYLMAALGIVGVASWVTIVYYTWFGLWHPETVQAIITGLKPLQSGANIVLFILNRRAHKAMLRQMNHVATQMQDLFNETSNYSCFNISICVSSAAFAIVTLLLRLSEYVTTRIVNPSAPQPMSWLFEYVPFVLLPMFSVWQVMPLAHYVMVLWMCRFWMRRLCFHLIDDRGLQRYPMRVYNQIFYEMIKLTSEFGSVFNLFVMFNFFLCNITLCLTIYFLTQSHTLFTQAEIELDVVFYFNICWSSVQIGVLLFYLVAFCISGSRTNEQARLIKFHALEIEAKNDEERHLIYVISEKVGMQYGWGISIWRGFLIERSLLLSTIGAIITYALILLRMKPTEFDGACTPALNDSQLLNATSSA